ENRRRQEGLDGLARALIVSAIAIGFVQSVAAADHVGRVLFGSVTVPGVTVTATQGDERRSTVTDEQGIYRLTNLTDGVWTLELEMLGFETLTAHVAVSPDAAPSTFQLKLRPFDAIAADHPPARIVPPEATRAPAGGALTDARTATPPTGFQ